MKNTRCMNCGGKHVEQFIDLGNQPNGNVFPVPEDFDREEVFSCIMLVCTDCWQVQIAEFPSPESMFKNHPYISGLNKPVVTHFEMLARHTVEKFGLETNSLVLDIGANDGTLLTKFRDLGMRVLGIDPAAKTNALARDSGITVFESFWDEESAKSMRKLGIVPDMITATAVFYHMENLHSFVRGLVYLMQEDTIFCAQCVYLKDVIEKGQFDHFYHEHTLIHSIGPLVELFSSYGLRLIDVDFYPIHGGSFVLYVAREESRYPTNQAIDNAIIMEEKSGLFQMQTYRDFAGRVRRNKEKLVAFLRQAREENKIVYGLGAPLKGSTLLNYYGIGPDLVDCVTEINPYKVGRFTPGTHIPIVDERKIKEHPDYYLVLSWNFIDFLVEKYQGYLAAGGKFIIPHPSIEIIGQEGDVNSTSL